MTALPDDAKGKSRARRRGKVNYGRALSSGDDDGGGMIVDINDAARRRLRWCCSSHHDGGGTDDCEQPSIKVELPKA